MERERGNWGFAAALWAALVVAAFSWTHPTSLHAVARVLPDLLLAATLVGGIAGTGRRLLRAMRVRSSDGYEELALGFAAGFPVLALAMFALGVAGWWTPVALFAVFVAVATLGWHELAKRRASWTVLPDGWREGGTLTRVFVVLGAASLVLAGILALVPPWHYDALTDHLAIPQFWLIAGGMAPMPDNMLSAFPKQQEVVYALAMQLGGPQAPGLLHVAMSAGTALLLHGAARREGGPVAGAAAAFTWLTAHVVLTLSGSATNDVAMAFFAAATFALLAMPGEERHPVGRAAAAGLVAGACLATKYTGAVPLLLALGWMAVRMVRSGRIGPIVAFKLAAAVPIVPWMLRAWHQTGDPVFPFLAGFFGVAEPLGSAAAAFVQEHRPAALSFSDLWTIPRDLVLHEERFHYGSIGAFAAATIPLLALARPVRPKPLIALGLALAIGVAWAATSQQMRYLFAAIPLVAYAAGCAVGSVRRPMLLGVVAAVALLTAGSAWLRTGATARRHFDPGPVLLGMESRDEHLSKRLEHHACVVRMNEEPEGSAVLLVGESRAAFLQRAWVGGTVDDVPWLRGALIDSRRAVAPLDGGESALIRDAFAQRGITHVLINRREGERLAREYRYFATPDRFEAFDAFVRAYGETLLEDRDCRLLRLASEPIARVQPLEAPKARSR